MEELFFEIYLPVIHTWFKSHNFSGYLSPETKKAFSQLRKYHNKIIIKDDLLDEIQLNISIIDKPFYIPEISKNAKDSYIIRIEFLYQFDYVKFVHESDKERTVEQQKLVSKKRLISRVVNSIKNVFIAINIAIPGSVSIDEGVVCINNKVVRKTQSLHSSLSEMKEYVKDKKWPKIKSLDILLVWNYLKNHNCHFNSYSKNKIEKAVYCFSYFFGGINNTEEHLVYSMMGIEAIYTKENYGLADQIDLKCQLLLGKLSEFKKTIKKLYDFRSRFFHGDLDIVPKHFKFEDDFQEYKVEHDFFDATL